MVAGSLWKKKSDEEKMIFAAHADIFIGRRGRAENGRFSASRPKERMIPEKVIEAAERVQSSSAASPSSSSGSAASPPVDVDEPDPVTPEKRCSSRANDKCGAKIMDAVVQVWNDEATPEKERMVLHKWLRDASAADTVLKKARANKLRMVLHKLLRVHGPVGLNKKKARARAAAPSLWGGRV